jgi:large subunit ribosomal protein L13
VRTFSPIATEITKEWYVVDADGLVLGRMATEIAVRLRGKHKAIFAPHVDTGDFVIVLNASKVVMTADKAGTKKAYRHSGYPGGLKEQSYADLLATKPDEVIRRAVRGMLPRTRLGRQQLAKLKVYAGAEHPHEAQRPQVLDLPGARRPA